MQTTILYNGVTIRDVLTESISHEPFKDSTGVDQIGVKVTVDCTGVVHCSTNPLLRGVAVRNLSSDLQALLAKLTKDRRPFSMRIGTSLLYAVKPGAAEYNAIQGTVTPDIGAMDLDNGPKPRVQILAIKGGYSATIRFQVEFVVLNCSGLPISQSTSSSQLAGLVSFRFWIAEDIDCTTWLTSRTYTGRLRVAHKHVSPHAVARFAIVPPLQAGFQRKILSAHESENGLELDFTIVDQELIAAPPWDRTSGRGATDWRGTFSIASAEHGQTEAGINLELTGPKTTSKLDLLTIAMRVVEQKTHVLALRSRGQAILLQFAAEETLHANTVSVSCRIRHTGERHYLTGIFSNGDFMEFGAPLGELGMGYHPQVAFAPGQTATIKGVFLSIVQSSCSPGSIPLIADQPPPPSGSQNQPTPGSAPIEGEPTPSTTPPTEDGVVTPGHQTAIYLDYRLDSELIADTGAAAFPTGRSSAMSQGNAGFPTLAVVNMYRPNCMREIRITASRVNLPPELPAVNVSFRDNNGILHTMIGKASVVAGAPTLSADARKLLYTADYFATYALHRPPTHAESVSVGAVPYRVSDYQDPSRRLPPGIFVAPEKLLR